MRKHKYKTLYVSDLDGTLLNSDSKLSLLSIKLLNQAIEEGAVISVATARTPATVSTLLKDVHLSSPLAVMTGAALWNPSDGSYSDIKYIPKSTVLNLIDLYRKMGLSSFIYCLYDGIIRIYHIGEMSALELAFISERVGNRYKTIHTDTDVSTLTEKELGSVILFYSMQPNKKAKAVYEAIKGMNEINPLCYHDIFGPDTAILEVFSKNASKAIAIERLKEITKTDRVVAFGDNINDIPMLEKADIAIATGNAVEQLKGKADIIIGSNDENSVAQTILEDYREHLTASPQ